MASLRGGVSHKGGRSGGGVLGDLGDTSRGGASGVTVELRGGVLHVGDSSRGGVKVTSIGGILGPTSRVGGIGTNRGGVLGVTRGGVLGAIRGGVSGEEMGGGVSLMLVMLMSSSVCLREGLSNAGGVESGRV